MAADLDRLVDEIKGLPREQKLQLVERLQWDGFFNDKQSCYRTPDKRKNENGGCLNRPDTMTPPGTIGSALLRFAGTIDQNDLREIEKAVNEGCEVINEEGW